jgi:hypothetical protein
MQQGAIEAAVGSNGKAAPEQVATPGDAIETGKSGGLFALPAIDETGKSVESSSKPATTTLDKDVAAPSADAANGAAKNNRVEVNAPIAAVMQSTMQPATGTVFQSLQDVSQGTHVDSVSPPKGSRAVEGVQAGTLTANGMLSPGIDTSGNSTVVTGTKTATMEKTSGEQLAGTDPQNIVASSAAASGGNQLAGSAEQTRGDASGGGADSSGSGDSAEPTPPSKSVLTTADLSQVGRGQPTAAPAGREAVASSANINLPPTHSATPPVSDAGVAKVLQSAMRGDVRVGVQTEAFGRVTIQTVAGNGQLSAQLSLENAKQSAALALHLPAVEQRLTQQYGLNASVNLASTSSRDAGGMASGGRGSNPNNNDQQNGGNSASARNGGFNPFSPTTSSAPAIRYAIPHYRGSSLSQGLDIIV